MVNFKKIKEGDFVSVKWYDAASSDDWLSETDAHFWKPSLSESAGWVLANEKNYITLAATRSLDDRTDSKYSEVTAIPKGWISQVVLINWKE